MKQAPLTFKLIINFVAYIGYTVFLSIIFSFLFPFVLTMMGKDLYNPEDPIFVKIQISIAIIVLLFTLIFRKYFYLSLRDNNFEEVKEDEKIVEKEDWLKFGDEFDSNLDKNIDDKKEKLDTKKDEYVFKMDDDIEEIEEKNKIKKDEYVFNMDDVKEVEDKKKENEKANKDDDQDDLKIFVDKEIKR